MSKKHKKFKKHSPKKNNVSQVVDQSNVISPSISTTDSISDQVQTEVIQPQKIDPMAELDEKYTFIRHDVRKLMLVFSILALIFVATYVASLRTDFLQTFGNWIYKVGNFAV